MKKTFTKNDNTKVTVENLHGNYPAYINGEYFSSKCLWTSEETYEIEFEGKTYNIHRDYMNAYGEWFEVHRGPNFYSNSEYYALWNNI